MKMRPAKMWIVPALAAALAATSTCTQAAATLQAPISKATPTTGVPTRTLSLSTPVSQEPAAGICASFDAEVIEITINPDIPDPRCARVSPKQKLKVTNATGGQIRVHIGPYEAALEQGDKHTFDTPLGEYLAPGVHLLEVLPCCGPELWLAEGSR